MTQYKFNCGCSFPIVKDGKETRLDWKPNYESLRLDCPETWDLICSGNTKGTFQLESKLGQRMASQAKPRNINELSDVISILRPGSLASKINNKTLTQHYIDRKANNEQVDYFHPALEPILKNTYGIICYQEQSLKIAQDIAGFSPEDSDLLRRAIGHKKTDEMAAMKDKFLEGCNKVGKVNKEEAMEIFGWIEKSQRYSFNKCLRYDTLILLSNGQEQTIEKLYKNKYRGLVLSVDLNTNKAVISEVTNISDEQYKKVLKLVLNNDKVIYATGNHKFITLDGIKQLNHMCINDKIKTITDMDDFTIGFENITSIEDTNELEQVYDITVKDTHTLMANNILCMNSHAVSYSLNAYMSAYAKTHFPKAFYTSWLFWAHKKINPHEEIQELIDDAKINNINVVPPDLRILNKHFKITNNNINFGLADIKGIGEIEFNKCTNILKEHDTPIEQLSWLDFLVRLSNKINKTLVTSLISAGALTFMLNNRIKMLYEYNIFSKLTKKEQAYIAKEPLEKIGSLADLLDMLIKGGVGRKTGVANKNRLQIIKDLQHSLLNPPYVLEDNDIWVSETERSLLGIPLTCAGVSKATAECSNITCKDALSAHSQQILLLACKVETIKQVKTKNGKKIGSKMAFVKLRDDSCSIDGVIFPDTYLECKDTLAVGQSVLVNAYRNDRSIIIKKIWQI